MTRETFNLIDAVQCQCIESWGVVEDVSTSTHFGTEEDVELRGQYLYVYQKKDELLTFLTPFQPTYRFEMGEGEWLNIYEIS